MEGKVKTSQVADSASRSACSQDQLISYDKECKDDQKIYILLFICSGFYNLKNCLESDQFNLHVQFMISDH